MFILLEMFNLILQIIISGDEQKRITVKKKKKTLIEDGFIPGNISKSFVLAVSEMR